MEEEALLGPSWEVDFVLPETMAVLCCASEALDLVQVPFRSCRVQSPLVVLDLDAFREEGRPDHPFRGRLMVGRVLFLQESALRLVLGNRLVD